MTPDEQLLPAAAGGSGRLVCRRGANASVSQPQRVAIPWPTATTTHARDGAGMQAGAAFALAAVSGVTYAAGFPPQSRTLAPWVALAPLFVGCTLLSPLRAGVAGMVWTAAAAAGAAWCFPDMLSRYFGLATIPSWLAAAAIIVIFHGMYVSSYAVWVAWLVQRRAAHPLLVASGWLACEFARAHGVLGSPWALTAYSQLGWPPLIQIADLAGPYGIGMLVAAVNACAAGLLVPALRGRRPLLAVGTVAAALACAVVYGQWRLATIFDDGPPLRVAVVQGGEAAASPSRRTARLTHYVTLTTDNAAAQSRLIVWPEYAVEAYLEEASPTRETVQRLTDATGADLVLGGPHYEATTAGTRYHNAAYLVRDGRVAARYDKHRLVPFAEEGVLTWLFGTSPTSYTPGDGSFILPATTMRVGALLCLEAMFPDLARQAVQQGAEVLVNLSNDAWFGEAEPARHQLDIATLRAVENRRYLVRAAATGISAVVDPYGRLLAHSAFGADEVLNATVRAAHVRTPYQRWGDAFAWLVIAAVASATLRPLLRQDVLRDNNGRL